jgi:hypothetical protein
VRSVRSGVQARSHPDRPSRHRLAEAATPLRRHSVAHTVEPAANSGAEQTAQAMGLCAYSPQRQVCYCLLARSCAESPQCFDSKFGAAVRPRWRVAVGPPPVSSGHRYRVDQPAPNEVHRRPTGNLSFDKSRQVPRHLGPRRTDLLLEAQSVEERINSLTVEA